MPLYVAYSFGCWQLWCAVQIDSVGLCDRPGVLPKTPSARRSFRRSMLLPMLKKAVWVDSATLRREVVVGRSVGLPKSVDELLK